MKKLSGRTAVVTGSSRTIGSAIALRLAEEGANVVVNARSSVEEAEAVVRNIHAMGAKALVVMCDVSTAHGVALLKREASETFGDVDILINNVGVSPRVPFLEITEDEWRTVMGVNIDSMFYACQAFAPAMMANNWGRIVNITGHAYLTVGKSGVHTKAGKAAAVGLTRGLAGELGPNNITVNHVAPGLIDTEPRKNKYYRDDKPSDLRPWGSLDRLQQVPLGRMGTASEMAALVAFLCTEEAAYLTGQTYLVNGGMMAV